MLDTELSYQLRAEDRLATNHLEQKFEFVARCLKAKVRKVRLVSSIRHGVGERSYRVEAVPEGSVDW